MLLLTPRSLLSSAARSLFLLGLGLGASAHGQGRETRTYQTACTLPSRLTALDSANGFHVYAFGTRLSEWTTPLPGLSAASGGRVTALLPTEPVVIGGLILRGIRLDFYNGRLAQLTFAPTSEAYAPELLRVLQALYGPGQPAGFNRVQWRGHLVTLVYELVITTKGVGRRVDTVEQGQVSLVNNALQAQAQEEQVVH